MYVPVQIAPAWLAWLAWLTWHVWLAVPGLAATPSFRTFCTRLFSYVSGLHPGFSDAPINKRLHSRACFRWNFCFSFLHALCLQLNCLDFLKFTLFSSSQAARGSHSYLKIRNFNFPPPNLQGSSKPHQLRRRHHKPSITTNNTCSPKDARSTILIEPIQTRV